MPSDMLELGSALPGFHAALNSGRGDINAENIKHKNNQSTGGTMHTDFLLITTEVPSWVILAAAIMMLVFASGMVYNLSDRFRRTRWVMKNKHNDIVWTTTHSFSPRELRKMMAQRGWQCVVIGRVEL